uniref:NADH-ubiquinone oxidoreductase chain 6 n=1 Tax=Luehdorfia chinensis TaxID=81069 RepID=A0A0K0LGS2_9NEOP|nr:NADH dehydrogenase subunit 6 [Luehdorfia chinensis]YP_010890273.1 NADH dehydrogenase subunit 6 [Luehdorfia chinensis huashanensis]AJA05961.1 NADH dehydrogenase subunit 6 [Luehdorfia chinensis]AJA05974.1 NADH dehydrogenase subunit 6 [Luehdorfia chinensis]AJA05987.1 NADH dehydrogenase subunit 6 [Luehdorfia chinensis]WJJ80174.1 NADH dehydrogenase subunit 6 [Luehdorfia chinensis huashanensis]
MTKILISLMIIFFSIYMLFLNHPLSMGLMILIQTMLTCLLSGMMINTYWFSYILFIVFLGGLLVLFIYMSSIASNELFNINFFNKMIIMLFFMLSFLIMFMFMYNLNWLNFFFNLEMNNMYNLFIFFNNENKINLSKLYNNQTYMMLMMLIIYLFITLVAVVKITNIFFGPLRPSNS